MREIKFRGKRLDNGEWVYGDLLRRSGATYIVYEDKPKDHNIRNIVIDSDNNPSYPPVTDWTIYELVDPETVGQYIGRKDKHNKEIYGGDIVDVVMHEDVCNPSTKYLIGYHNTGFYLKGKDIEGDIGFIEICGGDCCIKSIEVISNIHENPTLWEEK